MKTDDVETAATLLEAIAEQAPVDEETRGLFTAAAEALTELSGEDTFTAWLAAGIKDAVQLAEERAEAALPTTVTLMYAAYDDTLSDKQIQAAFTGAPPWEDSDLDEWVSEATRMGAWAVLEDVVDEEDLNLLRSGSEIDELLIKVEERDDSNVYDDLVRNTGSKWLRYSLDIESASDWTADDAQIAADMAQIAEAVGVGVDEHAEVLRELVTEAQGGVVHVLWYGEIGELIEACQACDANGKQLPATITWENPHLLILNSVSGSGHMVDLSSTVTLPFDRNRLKLDARGIGNGYSWSDEVAGLTSDRNTTTVTITQNINPEGITG